MDQRTVTAKEMRDAWIVEGEARLEVLGEAELRVDCTGQATLWCPDVYVGRVAVEFDCMVADEGTKLLLLAHGHGVDDTPIRDWPRDGSYDSYNAGPMEVYTIAVNRGPHVSDRPGDQFANVRRIGGPEFARYTSAAFQQDPKPERPLWHAWDTLSLVGAALEPTCGVGQYLRYGVTIEPPRILLQVQGARFAELVDHRPSPLAKGCVGFRCMTRGKSFCLRHVVLGGERMGTAGG